MAIFDVGYSYNWGFPVIAGLAFEVSVCDAVFEFLQTASSFLSAPVCIACTGGGFTGGGLGGFCRGFHLLEGLVPGYVYSLRGGGLLVTDGFQSVLFGGDGVRKGLSGLFWQMPRPALLPSVHRSWPALRRWHRCARPPPAAARQASPVLACCRPPCRCWR